MKAWDHCWLLLLFYILNLKQMKMKYKQYKKYLHAGYLIQLLYILPAANIWFNH